jgi:WD40 repeat protein
MVQHWDVADQTQPRFLRTITDRATTAAFAPDGTTLALGRHEGSIRVWQPASGLETMLHRGYTSLVHCLAFSVAGRMLASGSHDSSVCL